MHAQLRAIHARHKKILILDRDRKGDIVQLSPPKIKNRIFDFMYRPLNFFDLSFFWYKLSEFDYFMEQSVYFEVSHTRPWKVLDADADADADIAVLQSRRKLPHY